MRVRAGLGWGAAVLAGAGLAGAQRPDSAATSVLAIEMRIRERWMHQRELARFTRYDDDEHSLRLDSVSSFDGSGRRLYHLSSGRGARVPIEVDAAGRVAPYSPTGGDPTRLLHDVTTRTVYSTIPTLERYWDLIPSFRPPALRPGASWVDTLDLSAVAKDEHGPVTRRIRGVRTSWLVRDTLAEGGRAWIVRDSASVVLDESYHKKDWLADAPLPVTRQATGVIRGRVVVNDSLGVAVVRADTTRLNGWARMVDAYGRRLRSDARYERMRSWEAVPIARHAAYTRALREAEERRWQGPVRSPSDPTEVRIANGDTVARDSVVAAWRMSRAPDEHLRLSRQLSWARDDAFARRFRQVQIAEGDTLAYLYYTAKPEGSIQQWNAEQVTRLVSALRRPEWVFQHGEFLVGRLEGDLLHSLASLPPAVTDTLWWPCTPEGCRLLAQLWPGGGNEALRDLSLYVRAVTDPLRHADAVRARAKERRAYFEPVLRLFGEASNRVAHGGLGKLPPQGADWREWNKWLKGDYRPTIGLQPTSGFGGLQGWDHGTELRFLALVEGRDLRRELRSAALRAEGDSARAVLAGLLLAAGEPPRQLDSLARVFREGDAVDVAVAHVELALHEQRAARERAARRERGAPQRPRPPVVPDSVRVALETLVDSLVSGVFANVADTSAHYLDADGLPPRVVERWRRFILSDSAWRSLPVTSQAERMSVRARRLGPFVMLDIISSGQRAVPQGAARRGSVSVSSQVLVPWDKGWKVIRRGSMMS